MIVTAQTIKILPNGKKWTRGAINLTKDVMDKLDNKEQVVTLIIIKSNERIDEAEIKSKLKQVQRIIEVEEELKKLKGEA